LKKKNQILETKKLSEQAALNENIYSLRIKKEKTVCVCVAKTKKKTDYIYSIQNNHIKNNRKVYSYI